MLRPIKHKKPGFSFSSEVFSICLKSAKVSDGSIRLIQTLGNRSTFGANTNVESETSRSRPSVTETTVNMFVNENVDSLVTFYIQKSTFSFTVTSAW